MRKIFTSIEHLLQPAAGAQHYFATLPLTKPQAQCFVKQLNNKHFVVVVVTFHLGDVDKALGRRCFRICSLELPLPDYS